MFEKIEPLFVFVLHVTDILTWVLKSIHTSYAIYKLYSERVYIITSTCYNGWYSKVSQWKTTGGSRHTSTFPIVYIVLSVHQRLESAKGAK